jgi:hypothetical protein
VALQLEPHNFNAKVRTPGKKFLLKTPKPTHEEFKRNSYWKHASKEVYEAYSRVCAYTCRYIDVPSGSIDHFYSKSTHPQQAYEWENYRLCMHRVNGHKGASVDAIDPFKVLPGWFVIDFPSCLVKAGVGLDEQTCQSVEATIKTLKLNDDDTFVQDRCDVMVMYACGDVALGYLKKHRPFLAVEVERQGIEHTVAKLFKTLGTAATEGVPQNGSAP